MLFNFSVRHKKRIRMHFRKCLRRDNVTKQIIESFNPLKF